MTTPKFEGESPLYRVSPQGSMTEVPSLRDQFAMAALAGLCADGYGYGEFEELASISYKYADAMLEARKDHGDA